MQNDTLTVKVRDHDTPDDNHILAKYTIADYKMFLSLIVMFNLASK